MKKKRSGSTIVEACIAILVVSYAIVVFISVADYMKIEALKQINNTANINCNSDGVQYNTHPYDIWPIDTSDQGQLALNKIDLILDLARKYLKKTVLLNAHDQFDPAETNFYKMPLVIIPNTSYTANHNNEHTMTPTSTQLIKVVDANNKITTGHMPYNYAGATNNLITKTVRQATGNPFSQIYLTIGDYSRTNQDGLMAPMQFLIGDYRPNVIPYPIDTTIPLFNFFESANIKDLNISSGDSSDIRQFANTRRFETCTRFYHWNSNIVESIAMNATLFTRVCDNGTYPPIGYKSYFGENNIKKNKFHLSVISNADLETDPRSHVENDLKDNYAGAILWIAQPGTSINSRDTKITTKYIDNFSQLNFRIVNPLNFWDLFETTRYISEQNTFPGRNTNDPLPRLELITEIPSTPNTLYEQSLDVDSSILDIFP